MRQTRRLPRRSGWLVPMLLAAVCAACGPWDRLEKVRLLQDEKGEFADTIEPLRALLDDRPDDAELNYRYGLALVRTGQAGIATWSLRRAVSSPEWSERAVPLLVAALMATGDHDDAIAVCTRFLEQNPDHPEILLLRAQIRLNLRSRADFEAMLADADRVLEIDRDNHDALIPRTVALLGLERVDEAAKALEELDALYRDDSLGLEGSPGFCIAGAMFAKEKGDLPLAEQRFAHCLETFAAEPLVLNASIEFFDSIDKSDRSIEILRAALDRAPTSHDLRLALALRLRALDKADEAEALLRDGPQSAQPAEVAEAWSTLGVFLLEQGDHAEAIEAIEKARALDVARSPQLTLAYADALLTARRYDDALALSEEMKLPAHREVVRGRVALARGESSAALRHFEEGLRLWPDNAVARYYTALAAEQIGDFERAIDEYRYAMRIDAAATDAYLRLARLQVARARDDEALWALTFYPGDRPEEVDAALLQIRILARSGRVKRPPEALLRRLFQAKRWGAAVAALGHGVRDRKGPDAALEAMRAVDPLDLADPAQADALEVFIDDLVATGRAAEARRLVDAGLKRHPDAAVFHALRGRALALAKAPADEVRGAYRRALELEPKNQRALVGLAQTERSAGALQAAWALYEQALAQDAYHAETVHGAAEVLVALERPREAESALDELLREVPYDAHAARMLADLRTARGAKDERTRELARRADYFGTKLAKPAESAQPPAQEGEPPGRKAEPT